MSRACHIRAVDMELWPAAWQAALNAQTLPACADGQDAEYVLCAWGFRADGPGALRRTLLEEMAWALWSRPDSAAVAYPLRVSLQSGRPPAVVRCRRNMLERVLADGGLALARAAVWETGVAQTAAARLPDVLRRLSGSGSLSACTRALLAERVGCRYAPDFRLRLSAALARVETRLRAFRRGAAGWHLAESMRVCAAMARLLGAWFRAPADDRLMARRRTWRCRVPRRFYGARCAPREGRRRVLMAMHWLELGGAEKVAVDLACGLPKERYAVYVTTDAPSENPWAERLRGHVEEVLHLPSFLPRGGAAEFFDSYLWSRGIDLMHIHHSGWAYDALPHLRRFHRDLKVLDTLHIVELPPHPGGYVEYAASRFEPFIDAHHVISLQLKRFLMQRWNVDEEKVHVVHANVDAGRFDPGQVPAGTIRRRFGIAEDAPVIAFVGRFVEQKRPLAFLRMAALLAARARRSGTARPRFLMLGDGPLRGRVCREIERLKLRSETFVLAETADPRTVYRDADVVVLSSENEGLALVVYEALCMGTPVVSTDVGAQRELVEPACLVPPQGDVALALAQAVQPLLEDAALRADVARRGREQVLARHRSEGALADLVALYDRLLAGARDGA